MMKLYAFTLVTFLCQLILSDTHKVPRIGIIGGGIGGTSCAFFLKSLFGSDGIIIDLFEADKIGGRLSVVNFMANEYEEGGSIIHNRNRYMSDFLKECNLSKRKSMNGLFGLYDGKDFVFSESEWSLKTLWRVLYRYGLGIWKLKSQIEKMLDKFDRIYELQRIEESYETVGALLAAMDPTFVDYLNTTSLSGFKSQGIPDLVINEIIMATILTNYGQNLEIHEMVGSVSVAGGFGDLWSVRGGNHKIPECLLNISQANLIPEQVSMVKKLDSGKLEIWSREGARNLDGETSENKRLYDAVVLAAPQTSDSKRKILFEGFEGGGIAFLGRYHKTVSTLIEGRLSQSRFPTRSPSIDEILSVKEGLTFSSIGRISPVEDSSEDSNVWKVFTQKPLREKEINSLFSEVSRKHVREWLAYPHYLSVRHPAKESFVLAPNVYHINAIEWAASAMEMSAIGAKNVALLLYKSMKSKNTDSKPSPDVDLSNYSQKNEL